MMPVPVHAVGRQGHYAGMVTRLVAFVVDLAVIWGVATIFGFLVSETARLATGSTLSFTGEPVLADVLIALWAFLYFSYQWALSGRTAGMALLGLRVVARDGSPAGGRQAFLRTLALPLSFLVICLGFVGILVHRERLALHDVLASTAVVYSWDARGARLRWLARQPQLPDPSRSPPGH